MYRKKKTYFHFFFTFIGITFCIQLAAGQTFTQTRYETEIKSSAYDFTVIPLKESGLALVHNPDKFESGKRINEVTLIDSAMQETWKTELKLEPESRFIGYEYMPGVLYLLYRLGETDYNDLLLLSIQLNTHAIEDYRIKHQFNLKLTQFFMVGTNAVFGGSISKESSIVIFELATRRVKLVPGFFLNNSDLLDLKANENGTFNALLVEHSTPTNARLMLRTYDETGSLLLDDIIDIDPDVVLLSGLTSTLKREELLITGFYGYGNASQAVGLYSVLVDPFTEQKIQYSEFSSLSQFADYLGPKRAAKTMARERERKEEGKRPELKIHAQPIRLQEQPHGFLLLSEIYVPAANFNSNSYNSFYYPGSAFYPYGSYPVRRGFNPPYTTYPAATPQNSEVRILETFVTLFDEKGKITFDQSLPLKDLKMNSLDQASDFATYKDKIILGYRKEDELFIKTGDLKTGDIQNDTLNIELKNASDVVHTEQVGDGNIRYWYENNFYVFGRQSIKDKKKDGTGFRYVFFINKLEAK